MTRYRLAARSIAYCPRRGLLPVAPRPAPIGLRLLSQTRVARAEDNNSSGNKPPAPPSASPPQPSKPENEPPKESETAAPSTIESEDITSAVPQPPKPVDAKPTSETPLVETSTPAAESPKQVSELPVETNVAPPAEPARASEAKVPVSQPPATPKKEKPKPKGGKELKAWLKQREKEGIMRAVDIASAVRSERAEEAQRFREEREAFYQASEEATKHVTIPESGILNLDQFKEVLKVPAPPVPKRPAILAQPMSRGRRKWTERYHESRKQMGLWPYDGIPAHRKSSWDRMLRKMGMKRKNIFRERGPTRRITGRKPKVFVQEPVRDFIKRAMDPERSTIRWAEWAMMKKGIQPIGSRRRRAAIRTSPNIPFEHMPYQCFQEALKILRADREEKFQALVKEEARLQRLVERDPSEMKGGLAKKQSRIQAHKAHIEKMTILVDINDPLVKRKSEDGLGDMEKPIYRKLARERWESYDKKIIAQRISQFKVVPDLLPVFDPTAAVELRWQRKTIAPGTKMACQDTEFPPALKVQVFDAGPRLVTVAVVDSDVPDPENDTFTSRCHFIATNIPLSPNKPNITIRQLNPSAIAVPWLPPFAQKGTNYHRLSIVVLEQESPYPLDVSKLTAIYSDGGTQGRDRFSLRSFRDKFNLRPIGYNIFRTQWDDGTAEVMAKYNIPGADIEFKRKRDPRIKPLRKRKGWEAKRQGPKYRELWKYTKRIRGWNDKKWRNSKMERKYRN